LIEGIPITIKARVGTNNHINSKAGFDFIPVVKYLLKVKNLKIDNTINTIYKIK
jgi:hypothetical protein